MNSKEFLNKIDKKQETASKYNFIVPFLDYAKSVLSTGCNCKIKQKHKLIEDRFQRLQKTTPANVWSEMEKFLNE